MKLNRAFSLFGGLPSGKKSAADQPSFEELLERYNNGQLVSGEDTSAPESEPKARTREPQDAKEEPMPPEEAAFAGRKSLGAFGTLLHSRKIMVLRLLIAAALLLLYGQQPGGMDREIAPFLGSCRYTYKNRGSGVGGL